MRHQQHASSRKQNRRPWNYSKSNKSVSNRLQSYPSSCVTLSWKHAHSTDGANRRHILFILDQIVSRQNNQTVKDSAAYVFQPNPKKPSCSPQPQSNKTPNKKDLSRWDSMGPNTQTPDCCCKKPFSAATPGIRLRTRRPNSWLISGRPVRLRKTTSE